MRSTCGLFRQMGTSSSSCQAAPLGGPEIVGYVENALLALVAIEATSTRQAKQSKVKQSMLQR